MHASEGDNILTIYQRTFSLLCCYFISVVFGHWTDDCEYEAVSCVQSINFLLNRQKLGNFRYHVPLREINPFLSSEV